MNATAHKDNIENWLGKFGAAPASGGAQALGALFAMGCYRCDLVCFTWNIKTVEGRDGLQTDGFYLCAC